MAAKTVPKVEYPIRRAAFILSAVRPEQFPAADRPEVAFAGRSNVGKSSLLNKLLLRRRLARTSRTPGRTQTINFFDVNGEMYFVDLPGYGYAKVPQAIQAAWGPMVEGYLAALRDLRTVVVLVDIRRDPGGEEKDLMAWLDQRGARPLIVVTKADKVSRSKQRGRAEAIGRALGTLETPIIFSAVSGQGREEILGELLTVCGLEKN
ncbi:MAG: YihA family ribosome biogenesis GTP-binding protein [Deltaproteobacteria bacterium]|nr:MAG: YihA family ribosome biogenesis GTP-binding protein [Deltaproteobacteria bacterium]